MGGYQDNFTPSQRVFDMKGTAQVSKIGFAKFRFTKYIRSVKAISEPGVDILYANVEVNLSPKAIQINSLI